MSERDLILVGGGLANTLIALRLLESQPHLNMLLLEQDEKLGGNHTWSFHGSDLSAAQREWLAPLISYSWEDYEVHFPKRTRTLPGSYHSITSEQLAEVAMSRLGSRVRTGVRVAEVLPDKVLLEDGSELGASAVIDGRGPTNSAHLDVRFQKFVGQVVQLESCHDLTSPVIMDATQSQDDGYRFFYLLPFTDRSVLIEDTRYSDGGHISREEYGQEIRQYAENRGWQIRTILREEAGVLPITLGGNIQRFWDEENPGVPRSGLRAALFHPATGYSLPNALRLADALAGVDDWSAANIYAVTRRESEALWAATGFYRLLNRLLFLAADPQERRVVLQRFYGLRAGLIARFYAGENNLLDKARILSGKPPVKPTRALSVIFGYRPDTSG